MKCWLAGAFIDASKPTFGKDNSPADKFTKIFGFRVGSPGSPRLVKTFVSSLCLLKAGVCFILDVQVDVFRPICHLHMSL